MVTLRCTVKTVKRFRLQVNEDPETGSGGRLGAWYVNLMSLGRQRLVLCVSEKSLLPVLIPARNSEFPGRISEYARLTLRALGIPGDQAAAEAEHLREYQIGRTQSRSILGVMNDYQHMTRFSRWDGSLLDLAIWLSESPFKPLETSPNHATRLLFGVERTRR